MKYLFQDWRVASDSLIGSDAGEGKGFYLQMAGLRMEDFKQQLVLLELCKELTKRRFL